MVVAIKLITVGRGPVGVSMITAIVRNGGGKVGFVC